jgi:putative transposase
VSALARPPRRDVWILDSCPTAAIMTGNYMAPHQINGHARRRSLRLRHYDYSQAGAYFITICVQDRACLFGQVIGNEMRPNEAGRMVQRWWAQLPRKFDSVDCDAFVVMPNHVHGIIVMMPPDAALGGHTGPPLPRIVQWFKSMTTNDYLRGVKESDWPTLPRRLWQRNCYEHTIRNDHALDRIRQYVFDNPARWAEDSENPLNIKSAGAT